MKVKGAIFDLDGTLLDSMFIWDTIGEEYLIHRGITPEKGLNEKFKTMSIVQAANYYRNNYGLTQSVKEIVDDVNSMIDHFYSHVVVLKNGVLPFLNKLRANDVKMCITTATDRYMAEAALKRNEIDEYFSTVFTCTEIGFGKDSPIIYQTALDKLGTDISETVIFEDALYAIETAKKAGFFTIGVYDASSAEEQSKIKALSDDYIHSFEDRRGIYD